MHTLSTAKENSEKKYGKLFYSGYNPSKLEMDTVWNPGTESQGPAQNDRPRV